MEYIRERKRIMADLYYHVWVTVTSLTIIILVAAYIIYDRIALSYQSLEETEKAARMQRLNSMTMIILGFLAFIGSIYWILYIQTHEIYITKELRGFHDIAPGIIMGTIGLISLAAGIRKHAAGNSK
jgi:formate hydrogenlyase subunit 3/multisubunit Na+/H+ antiporter MnhD subunit